MIATISLGTRISVQGDLVSRLPCGDALVRVGTRLYRGRQVEAQDGEAPAAIPAGFRRVAEARAV
jgi:hypothetical protein